MNRGSLASLGTFLTLVACNQQDTRGLEGDPSSSRADAGNGTRPRAFLAASTRRPEALDSN